MNYRIDCKDCGATLFTRCTVDDCPRCKRSLVGSNTFAIDPRNYVASDPLQEKFVLIENRLDTIERRLDAIEQNISEV